MVNTADETIVVRRHTLTKLCGLLLEAERAAALIRRQHKLGAAKEKSLAVIAECHDARGIISDLIDNRGDTTK